MKENVFDILMYLFEHYFHDAVDIDPDRGRVEADLLEAGFTRSEIHKALNWIDALAETRELPSGSSLQPATRIFTEAECRQLDTECRGFLVFLEQAGVLTPTNREVVVDRIMALEDGDIALDKLKWVVLMVLFSLPGQEAACAWMENLLFDHPSPLTH